MKFRVQAQDLNAALEVASIVSPRPVTSEKGAGYVFIVKGEQCFIYSRDVAQRVRTEVPISDVDGEGLFAYPADKIAGLKYVSGWITFEAGHDEEEDRYWVRFETEGGGSGNWLTFDPRLVPSLDEELEKVGDEHVFPAALLREGITATKACLPKLTDTLADERFQTLQLFDKSKKEWERGDGHLYAADNIRCCYFFCDAFRGKGLAIHSQHLPSVASFLAKCEGNVTVKLGETVTFVVDERGQVLGWAHHVKQYGKFKYYSSKMDKFLLRVPKESLVRALRRVRAELDSTQDKIRIQYTHEDKSLRFQASEASGQSRSDPVGVDPIEEDGAGGDGLSKDFTANANVTHLLELVEPVKGHQVELRVAIAKKEGQPEMKLFRTVEEFWLSNSGKVLIAPDDSKDEAYQCRVTRFMPSMS